MSSILKNAAVAAVIGNQPSTFYDRENRPNPLLQALDQELKLFTTFMKKKSLPGYLKPEEESHSLPFNKLSELWNKYQSRLPPLYYQEKLLDMGEFLLSVKEYKVAVWQCFERYLKPYANIDIKQIPDASTFVAAYFPNGLKNENAVLMSRALMGKVMCMFHVEKQNDPKFQNKQSVDRCLHILAFLRLITQILLPREYLCWLVYNGTIHIYTVARHFMSLGHSAVVLEYLLWASVCMETSVPLLTAKYISWRATLYTAVCQCYYDCMAGEHAENFARRGLTKINELSSLELSSSDKSIAVYEDSFRSATVRMASMVFKRAVFETRRKPKGLLRPKTRTNLKETLHLPWPRTPTETMLTEMFDGSSAQFLAILESLSNSNVRILQTAPPASDSEPEILDVYSELLMAAQEILAGGGGNRVPSGKSQMVTGAQPLAGVTCQGSLIQMATKGKETVPLESVIRLMKFAFVYEQFDVFEALLGPVMVIIKESKDERFRWDEKSLELLSIMLKLNSSRKQKKVTPNTEEEELDKAALQVQAKKGKAKGKAQEKPLEKPPEPEASVKSNYGDDMIQAADVLLSIVNGSYQKHEVDIDIVVDATLFLWNKCKPVFQKYQTGSADNPRFLQKMENPNKEVDATAAMSLTNAGDNEDQDVPIVFSTRSYKSAWIYLLDTVHQLVSWSGISNIDPTLAAEVSLRLALVYESSAVEVVKSAQRDSRATVSDFDAAQGGGNLNTTIPSQVPAGTRVSPKDQLLRAKEIVQLGLRNVNSARRAMAVNDLENIVDVHCIKEFYSDIFTSGLPKEKSEDKDGSTDTNRMFSDTLNKQTSTLYNTIRDLHVELLLVYHRICLKLSALATDISSTSDKRTSKKNKRDKKENQTQNLAEDIENFKELCNQCKKNSLSKALLFAQRAVMLGTELEPKNEQKKLLEDAVNLVQRAQAEEKKILLNNSDTTEPIVRKVPPPPVLVCRTDTFMVFKPAPFEPESGEQVAWYRIFARSISEANVKVRLSDNCFPGTGEEVPSFHCVMKVTNLEPNKRYVFAVAAYTANGKLIGDHIGETTKSFVASHPLPVLTTWAFIYQMAYQSGCYSVATQAFNVLWDYFVMKPHTSCDTTYVANAKKDFKVSLLRLNKGALNLSSPVLLRLFLANIFINSDIAVKEGQLFCDAICEKGILYGRQIQRLRQCERLLVAIELACWLNETSLALQTVVQIYGLLAPMLYHKIPSISVVQILHRCHAVLKEIPQDLINKRQSSVSDSLKHMVACSTYYVAKVLKIWGQNDIANSTVEIGRYLLGADADVKLAEERGIASDEQREISGKQGKPPALKKQMHHENAASEELMALEACMMGKCEGIDSDLLGSEDSKMIHAHISCLPSSVAFKEVEKFKSRPNYMELLVRVSQKGLAEGLADQVLQWSDDGIKWLTKRTFESFGNLNFMKKPQVAMTVSGHDPKKFGATMVEYKKDGKGTKTEKAAASKTTEKKRNKYKPLRVSTSMSETASMRQEDAELKALETLCLHFVDLYKTRVSRHKWRKMVASDTPWRSQMNIIQGLCHLNLLLVKIKNREKMIGVSVNRTNYLDHEWFTLETVGVMVAGWDGGPSKSLPGHDSTTMVEDLEFEQTKLYERMVEKQTPTLIELAAAEVAEPIVVPAVIAKTQEFEETPRTAKSDKTYTTSESKSQTDILTAGATLKILKNVLTSFRRALVLAHRGQQWTLLQNAGRTLWNCAHVVLLRACAADHSFGDHGLLTVDLLHSALWHTFYVASDCLLDMLADLQDSLEKQTSRTKSKGKILEEYSGSLMGTPHSERGGASLKFDSPSDDASLVDTRFIRRLVLRTLELLYTQQKWEKLVDIALRFNALTDNRYAEQVLPLVVQAQRLLETRINEAGGEAPPQSHIRDLQAQLGHVIHAKDYLKAQLRVQIKRETMALNETVTTPGAVDNKAYIPQDAYHLSAVPVSTAVTLRELYDSVDQVHYTARALQHSRKLLCLYLAGEQNFVEELLDPRSTRVDFKVYIQQTLPQMPPKKITSDFSNADDVQLCPLPQSHLSTVISSYERTIDMLLGKNMKGLAAQAMHELGNICFHSQNTRAAFKWWSQGLDLILNTTDAVHTWRTSTPNIQDVSSAFLDRCGLWGCLLAGVLASNIAQYIMTENSGTRIECCLLSGLLFKALLRSTLPHPTADRDYAVYFIGEGFEVTTLTPGIDFVSEKFRCDGRQLVGALKWVTEELSRAQYNLFVLPLLTLQQYFCSSVCRDVEQTVSSRILRVRVLADLGLYAEAFAVIQQLLNGEYLPHAGDSSLRSKDVKSSLLYNNSKSLTEAQNQKVILDLMDKRLSQNVSTLYGPHLTCSLALAKAHVLINLANTVPLIAKMDDATKISKGRPDSKPEFHKTKSAVYTKFPANSNTVDSVESTEVLPSGYRGLSTEAFKNSIIASTEQTIIAMMNVILEKSAEERQGTDALTAAELELVVQCRLELTYIAQQRHHAYMAAQTVLAAMKMLQSSQIFKSFKPERSLSIRPPSLKSYSSKSLQTRFTELKHRHQYENLQAHVRLDGRLWLQCRCELIRSLLMEVRGMGDIIGTDGKMIPDLAECRQYLVEGLGEAEVWGNIEMQAYFLFLGARLNIIEGKSLQHTISLLKDAIGLLNQIAQRSDSGDLLLATCMVQKADLEAIVKSGKSETLTQDTLKEYLDAHKIVLQQVELLGEKIEHSCSNVEYLSSPVSPLTNLYLPQNQRLAQIKLRIGHAIARNRVKMITNRGLPSDHLWTDSLAVLTAALSVNRISMSKDSSLEAEILFEMGKVQKMMVYLNMFDVNEAVHTLLKAIKMSNNSGQDLGLMRQSYLEIALIYLYSCGLMTVTEDFHLDPAIEPNLLDASSKSELPEDKQEAEKEREKKAVRLAISCAATVAQAQWSRNQITGDISVITQKLEDRAVSSAPDFVLLDLLSRNVLGKEQKVYANEIEEELSVLLQANEPKIIESYDSQVSKVKKSAMSLKWIHLLGYQTILQRLVSTASTAMSSYQRSDGTKEKHKENDIDLQLTRHSDFDSVENHDVVRYMLLSAGWQLRLTSIHNFLSANLKTYEELCCAPSPPADLNLPRRTWPSVDTKGNVKSNVPNFALSMENMNLRRATLASNLFYDQKKADYGVSVEGDSQLSVQWYQPGLGEDGSSVSGSDVNEKQILLLFALTSKECKPVQGFKWVSLRKLYDLHDRMFVLVQKVDMHVMVKPPPTTGMETARLSKASTPNLDPQDQLEIAFRKCLDDVWVLLKGKPQYNKDTLPEFNADNIQKFERLLDPSTGLLLKGDELLPWLCELFM